ncbi:type II secretion system protein GspD [Oleiharenicola sp. Vm1]|uniref:type II secretion system protein GspD n=1 Tax=Oleiharenicola sp. Vm1 TaxID=3398393 RepID=UPI0039F53997
MRTRPVVSAALALTLLGTVTAQNKPATPPAAAPADQPAATVAGAQPTQHSVSRDKDTLSVDFPDEDIKTILRNVADLFELNLVVPDTLVGKTSIKLRDVTWRQIFETVLSPANYTYVEEGNIVKVVSRESLMQEPVSTEVFILNNAKAFDIKPTVDGLVDAAQGGKILIDARSNALVITTQPSRMTRIRAIIEKLDKATDQVMIESKFVEVSDSDIRNIGVNWASLGSGVNLSASKLTNTFQRSRGQDYSQGSTNNGTTQNGTQTTNSTTNTTGNDTLAKTDNVNQQGSTVTYTAIPNGSGTGSFATGTVNLPGGSISGMPSSVNANISPSNYTPASGTSPASFTAPVTINNTVTNTAQNTVTTTTGASTNNGTIATNSVSDTVTNLLGLTNTGGTSRLATAVFSASDFNIIVSALKTQNNTKVISNPTIVTLNNTEAFINIGSEYPIPSYTYNSERGTFEVSGFQYKPIGVILKVTPQVNAQGTIRMAIEPEISSSNRQTTFGGAGGASIPIIDTRKVKTQVSLKDGYTAGIGGLMSATKAHGSTKVPVLGSIPVLGRLFSSKSVNDVTTNLLIFITAKTVAADGADPAQVFNAAALEAAGETPAPKAK